MFQLNLHISWQFEILDMLFHFTLGHNSVQIILTMKKLVKYSGR